MPSLTLSLPYIKDIVPILTASELMGLYLYGVEIKGPGGSSLSDEVIEEYILFAQEETEKFLEIKLNPHKEITETRDYHWEDWVNYGFMSTSYPVRKICGIEGYLGQTKLLDVPLEWISLKQSSEGKFWRQITFAPANTGSVGGFIFSNIGLTNFSTGWFTRGHTPNHWKVKYKSGYLTLPRDLLNFIGKLAAINVLNIAGNNVLPGGLSSTSISIDGLSQSLGTVASSQGTAYSGLVTQYINDLVLSREKLEKYYKGIPLVIL